MALLGYEWLIVLGIIVLIFMWGPRKIKEFAESTVQARRELTTREEETT